ncbi:hypothetical protein DER46DRAFT_700805 [Fusarium sp. MPI-SDFR-AT-0072]|nr:hypothetical protein DER46DRAFT_700805 [Fusarium sp. MPI-SDFR-AT-0072]
MSDNDHDHDHGGQTHGGQDHGDGDHGGQTHGDGDHGDFGLTAAPHLEPEVGLEWPDFQNPENASVGEVVLSGQLRFVARQNQALMGVVQNLYSAISESQSRRSSMSSTGASSDAGDSVHLRMPDENAERVAQAYQTLIEGGEIYETVAQFHGVFVQLNSKKLYVMRNTTSTKDAQTFAQHVIKQIEDKQSDPAGQEDTDLVERQDVILTNLKLLTPDLTTDLYIMLNKAKKANDLKDQPDKDNKGKRKATSKKKAKATQDGTSAVVTGDDGHHESDDGTENRNRTTAGGPSRQLSLNSQASSPVKRSLRSRQISGSSGVGADAAASSQHSQASATTIQRRRSKQKTRFVLSDNDEDEDEDAEDEL